MVEAPGWPGIPARWTSSAKDGVGAALSERSRVWFTISHGIVNEIYYPRVDQACVRDLGLIVTDGGSFLRRGQARLPDGRRAYRRRGSRFPPDEHASRRPIPDDQSRDHGPAQRFGRSAHSPRRFLQDRAARVRLARARISSTRGRTTTASSPSTRGTTCSAQSAAARIWRCWRTRSSSPGPSASSAPPTDGGSFAIMGV